MTPEREAEFNAAKNDMVIYMQTWARRLELTDREVLAIMAYMTGAAIAMQDQFTMTHDLAMEIVLTNIQAGNQSAMADLMNTKGNA